MYSRPRKTDNPYYRDLEKEIPPQLQNPRLGKPQVATVLRFVTSLEIDLGLEPWELCRDYPSYK